MGDFQGSIAATDESSVTTGLERLAFSKRPLCRSPAGAAVVGSWRTFRGSALPAFSERVNLSVPS
jgi:hypothetical protein